MPKEFGDWMKEMAGTIPDTSWTGQNIDKGNISPEKLTNEQVRWRFATLLSGAVTGDQSLQRWMKIYTLDITNTDASGQLDDFLECNFSVLDDEWVGSYIGRMDDKESIEWWVEFSTYIFSKGEEDGD